MMQRSPNSRVKHGDASCADYGCKRQECIQARRDKKKRNRFLRATGRPGYVSASRATAHLHRFRTAGLQDKEIMTLVGVGRSTYYRVIRGEQITRASEQRILSVPAPASTGSVTTTALQDATGTHRRLQALIWLGWPSEEIEARLGVHAYWVSRSFRGSRVRMVLAVRVEELYDALWSARPELHGVDEFKAEDARRYARSQSWHGPLAWDDDTIDDPSALPVMDVAAPAGATQGGNLAARYLAGEAVILDQAARKEVLANRFEWSNLTIDEIAAELEMSPDAAEQAWSRMKKAAKADGRRLWRRVYVARDRDLKQSEMEEVA